MIRYLLGDLNDGEQRRIEEGYFLDNDSYTQILVTEDELIDSYVLDELSEDDRQRFEQVYLTNPYRLKKVESSRSILNLISNKPPLRKSLGQRFKSSILRSFPVHNLGLRYSFAGLLLVGMLCGLVCWLIVDQVHMRRELEQARSQWQQKESEYQRQLARLKELPSPASERSNGTPENAKQTERGTQDQAKEPHRRSASKEEDERGRGAPAVVAFAIPHGIVRTLGRGARSLKPLVIPRGTVLVRLRLDVERNEYGAYSVLLQKVGGTENWLRAVPNSGSEFSAKQIEVDVPGAFFKTGDYILKVTGTNASGEEEILAFHQITAINRNRTSEKSDVAR